MKSADVLDALRDPHENVESRRGILVLEDDRQLLNLLESELAAQGYDVFAAASEAELRVFLSDPRFELVILDLALEGSPYRGLELVRAIRNARNVPILVISAHVEPWDRLRALEMGIDDYITKPFLLGEVLIRLQRILKAYSPEEPPNAAQEPAFDFAGLRLDPLARAVTAADGQALDLTETKFNILRLLAAAAGRIVSRDELWRALRGEAWSPAERALDGHVARLRAKLEPSAERPQIIKSARGIGYVLACPVTRVPH